jgi:hypothetical protein
MKATERTRAWRFARIGSGIFGLIGLWSLTWRHQSLCL